MENDGGVRRQIKCTLPSLPPSHNRLYVVNHIQRKVYLSDDARRWKSKMMLLVPRFDIADSSLLRIDYVAYYAWLHHNGKRRKLDASNFMKLLHDTVCAKLGVDDSRVSEGSFASVDSVGEKVDIVMTEITEATWRAQQ